MEIIYEKKKLNTLKALEHKNKVWFSFLTQKKRFMQ